MKSSIRELSERELKCVTGGMNKQDKEESLGKAVLGFVGTIIGMTIYGYIIDPLIDKIREVVSYGNS